MVQRDDLTMPSSACARNWGGGGGGGDEGFTRFSALILNLYADTVSSDPLP